MYLAQCIRGTGWILSVVLWSLLSVSPVGAEGGESSADRTVVVRGIQPAIPVPELEPGLAVRYYVGFFKRDLRKLPAAISPEYTSFSGEPILQLDNAFGRGQVFASGESQGVGMRMRGYLHFSRKGTYLLQALSNDGIIMTVDGQTALSDPRQHSDRLSNRAEVMVEQPGWYPVEIAYFQRKGTATLRLLWKEPGGTKLVAIPAEGYGHRPKR